MPRPIGPSAGTANRRPSISLALPISAHARGGGASCCSPTPGVTRNKRSCWKSVRTFGDAGTRTWLSKDDGWGRWCGASLPTMPFPPTSERSRRSATMSLNSGAAPCAGVARRIERRGQTWTGWRDVGCPDPGYPIPGPQCASASNTLGGSRMREFRPYGSVRGAPSNGRPYRDLPAKLWCFLQQWKRTVLVRLRHDRRVAKHERRVQLVQRPSSRQRHRHADLVLQQFQHLVHAGIAVRCQRVTIHPPHPYPVGAHSNSLHYIRPPPETPL